MVNWNICVCHDCAQASCLDPQTGNEVPGRLFNDGDLEIHELTSIDRDPWPPTVRNPAVLPDPPQENDYQPLNASREAGALPLPAEPAGLMTLRTLRSRLSGIEEEMQGLKRETFCFELPVSSDLLGPAYHRTTLKKGHNRVLDDFERRMDQDSETISIGRSSSNSLIRHHANELYGLFNEVAVKWHGVKEAKRAQQRHPVSQAPIRSVTSTGSYLVFVLTVLTLHCLARLSIPGSVFLIVALKALARAVWVEAGMDLNSDQFLSTEHAPRTLETLIARSGIEPALKSHPCCPKCFKTWDVGSPLPKHCDAPLLPQSRPTQPQPDQSPGPSIDQPQAETPPQPTLKCGRSLQDPDAKAKYKYVQQDFQSWLGRFCARSDIAEYLEPDAIKRSTDGVLRDVWDGECLREFKGPDGRQFVRADVDEGRLVFAFNQDGTNPHDNRAAGKIRSVGPMYLVCLNLPEDIRWRVENVFVVGIIPGPEGPAEAQVNDILDRVIQDLLVAWTTGILITETPLHPHGRLFRCAVVPLVCDLPATRQMAGLVHYQSYHWCNFCSCTSADESLDVQRWTTMSREEHLRCARLWQNAASEEERSELFRYHRVRWTPFLDLPYWDPTRFILIDSMHCFYLGLLRRHLRLVWGMDIDLEDGPEQASSLYADEPPPKPGEVEVVLTTISNGLNLPKDYQASALRTACRHLKLRHAGSKEEMTKRLVEYYSERLKSETIPDYLKRFFRYAPKTQLAQLSFDHLVAMCCRYIPKPGKDFSACRPSALLEMLQTQRRKSGYLTSSGHILAPQPKEYNTDAINLAELLKKPRKKTVTLGRTILAEIQKDIGNYELPPFAGSPPTQLGVKKGGKLKADQWRVLCTHQLVYTLVRLWGPFRTSTVPEEIRKYEMLKNYLDLVEAVKIATSPTQTEVSIQLYEVTIERYLHRLLELYPGTSLTPNQHLAHAHYGRLLRNFGPDHAWRCWAFERYNGILKRFKTNKRHGYMELTMLQSFCRQQNLRVMYGSGLPEFLKPMADAFRTTFMSDLRGAMAQETEATAPSKRATLAHVSSDVRAACLLLVPQASRDSGLFEIPKARQQGRILFPKMIVTMPNGKIGRIQRLVHFEDDLAVMALVNLYRDLPPTSDNPFSQFKPQIAGTLVQDAYGVKDAVFPLVNLLPCSSIVHRTPGVGPRARLVIPWEIPTEDLIDY